jgi:hypothetical protein
VCVCVIVLELCDRVGVCVIVLECVCDRVGEKSHTLHWSEPEESKAGRKRGGAKRRRDAERERERETSVYVLQVRDPLVAEAGGGGGGRRPPFASHRPLRRSSVWTPYGSPLIVHLEASRDST